MVAALATLLIVAPMLARLPSARGFDHIVFVGGPGVGPVILTTVAALLLASTLRVNADVRALGLMVFSFFASVALAAVLAPALSDHPFVVVYLYAPALFVTTTLIPGLFAGAYGWLKPGALSKRVTLALLVLTPASLASLTLYFGIVQPDLTHQPLMRSGSPLGWLIVVGIGIAALNSAVEEAIYRGVFFHALERTLRAPMAVVSIQAAAFGAFHFNSNEPGLIGVTATFALGLVLGALRQAGGGLWAPYLLHFAMDIGVWMLGVYQLRA